MSPLQGFSLDFATTLAALGLITTWSLVLLQFKMMEAPTSSSSNQTDNSTLLNMTNSDQTFNNTLLNMTTYNQTINMSQAINNTLNMTNF
jgi:hypothetical protein